MKKYYFYLLISFLTISFLTSCESFKESEKVVTQFYDMSKSGSYTDLQTILSPTALEASPIEEWNSVISKKDYAMGKLISYKNTYTGVKTNNGETTYELKYDVEYENGTMSELFFTEKVDDKIYIRYYEYDNKLVDSKSVKELSGTPQEKVCAEFFNNLKLKHYNEIIPLISTIAQANNPIKDWIDVFQSLEKNYGGLKNYTLISNEEKEYENDGIHYELVYKVELESITLYEKFQFLKTEEPEKIKFFAYNSNLDEL